MKDFTEELKRVPEKPGVYQMFNQAGEIIYVGKAVNLRRRVRSYFQKSQHGKSPKVLAMVEHVDHFEYIIVENEVEALVLESNFIKEHEPKYNIILRDDKQYPYIEITREKFPRLKKVRQTGKDGGRYFGPFPNAYAVNDTIRLLQRAYHIRTCRINFDQPGWRLKRPCLNYYIDQCPAPCVGKADEEAYMQSVERLAEVLKGKNTDLRRELERKMKEAADKLQFERAAEYRDQLMSLEQLGERQRATMVNGEDADVIAMAQGRGRVTIQLFFVRSGKVVDRRHFQIREEYEEDRAEILSSFMKQFYLDAPYIPAEILTEVLPADSQPIQAFLEEKKGQKVSLHVPQRGKKAGLVRTAHANAEHQLELLLKRQERKEREANSGVHALEVLTGVEEIQRLEAYDVSNISGVQNVGSMVVYQREKREPREYRKFKIRTVEGINEYASQREMLERRFDHGLKDREEGRNRTGFGLFPSLILMDGGKGQVHLAEEVLAERGLAIPVVGMVKDEHHKSRALYYRGQEFEMDPRSPLYKYIYEIQEEVHRFAISYHRSLRTKDMVHSELDEIKGIGKTRRQALMEAYGSLEELKQAGVEDLAKVRSMNRQAAEAVYRHFHEEEWDGSK